LLLVRREMLGFVEELDIVALHAQSLRLRVLGLTLLFLYSFLLFFDLLIKLVENPKCFETVRKFYVLKLVTLKEDLLKILDRYLCSNIKEVSIDIAQQIFKQRLILVYDCASPLKLSQTQSQ
jgi:hypothetical protein